MKCIHCQRCCHETQMELSGRDIERLSSRGYAAEDFLIIGNDKIPRLANKNGFCIFYDKPRRRCREYLSRPTGCRIYPVNVDPEGNIVIDDCCKAASSLSRDELERKGRRLIRLLKEIDNEAESRELASEISAKST